MADENIISVSSAAAESDPGNAENFLLGILPVSYLIFPYHTPGFLAVLPVSLPYPLFPYHTPSFSKIPYHTPCILPYHTLSYLQFAFHATSLWLLVRWRLFIPLGSEHSQILVVWKCSSLW